MDASLVETPSGIFTSSREIQCSNADSPMFEMFFDSLIFFKFEQDIKALGPILVKESGIMMLSRSSQREKAEDSILSKFLGRSMCLSPSQSAKTKEFKMHVHHDFKWLDKEELLTLDWAPADIPIVNKVLEEM